MEADTSRTGLGKRLPNDLRCIRLSVPEGAQRQRWLAQRLAQCRRDHPAHADSGLTRGCGFVAWGACIEQRQHGLFLYETQHQAFPRQTGSKSEGSVVDAHINEGAPDYQ